MYCAIQVLPPAKSEGSAKKRFGSYKKKKTRMERGCYKAVIMARLSVIQDCAPKAHNENREPTTSITSPLVQPHFRTFETIVPESLTIFNLSPGTYNKTLSGRKCYEVFTAR